MSENPKQAARRLAAPWIAKGYVPRALHEYRSADGSPIYWRIRLEHPDGDTAPDGRKIIRPMKLNGSGYTFGEPDFPSRKPLYCLDRIAAEPTSPVWIVEGEKAADALTKLGAIATTSGGADSADRADWTPLRGRECRLWRDNDEAGTEYAGNVAAILLPLGCRLSAVDVDRLGLPAKGDAWDWLQAQENAELADLDALPMLTPSPLPANATAGDSGPRVELLCAADVRAEAVHWHWREWIAAGKLHILAGPAGTGKTTLAIALAATLTIGGRWPDGTRASVADVVIWSGEDGIADTLVPRLAANGADSARVHFVRNVADDWERRPFDPATDTPLLALALSRLPTPPALLIVDPIVSAVAGDSHKNSETRRSLQPLVDLGERIGCAILGISHFSKGTAGRDPVERVTGSIAFGALARVVMAAVKTTAHDGTPGPRLFARAKNNLGPDGGGFHYSLDQVPLPGSPDVTASRVLWGDAVDGDAKSLLATAETEGDPEERAINDDALSWLTDALTDAGGQMERRDVLAAAKRAGFSERTVYRARDKAGVHSRSEGFGEKKRSVWTLPIAARSPILANAANLSSLAGMAEMLPAGRNEADGEIF